jgi:uncharacterized membrane protein
MPLSNPTQDAIRHHRNGAGLRRKVGAGGTACGATTGTAAKGGGMRGIASACGKRCRQLLAATGLALAAWSGDALCGEPKVTVNVSRNGEAFVIDAAIEVDVPLATAWGVLTDFDNMTTILGNLTSSKVTSREGNTWIVKQEGVAKFGLFSFPFWSEREVRLEPMQKIMVKGLAGSVKQMSSETRTDARGPDVQIRYHAEIVPDSFLARVFGGSFVRHEVREQFLAMSREMMRRHEK